MAVDIKNAVAQVVAYVNGFGGLLQTPGMRLEETEYDDRDSSWQITMSFFDNPAIGTRVYRTFFLDQDGTVIAMKNKKLF